MADFDQTASAAWPRWLNFLIGVWLFISAWVWPHTMAAQTNTWIVGALIAIAAIWAMFAPPVRLVNTILAIWLFFSTLFIYHASAATLWNNLIVAVVVFALSLVPSGAMTVGGSRRAIPAA